MELKNRLLNWRSAFELEIMWRQCFGVAKLLVVMLLLGHFNVQAQLINIEGKRILGKEGLSGSVAFGGSWSENVNQVLMLENQIGIQYQYKAHLLMLFNDLDIVKVNNEDVANHGYQHLRYNYTLGDSSAYTLELFGQRQDDVVRKLGLRTIAGGGMRFRLFSNSKGYLYFAPLVMFEHEEFIDDANPEFNLLKLDAYLVFNLRLNPNVSFNSITYYQPAFSNLNRFRIAHTSSLNVVLWKKLSFLVSYVLNQDNYPAEGVPKRYSKLSNTLKYEF